MHAGDEIPDTIFGPMFDLYLSTIEKLYWGRHYLTREFFDLMRERFKRYVCLVCAYRGRKLIGGTFNLQKSGVLYGRYWGCFEDLKFLHFNVCYYAAIEHCIANGMRASSRAPAASTSGCAASIRHSRTAPTISRTTACAARIGNFLVRERREVEAWIAEGHERSQLKPPPPSNTEQP